MAYEFKRTPDNDNWADQVGMHEMPEGSPELRVCRLLAEAMQVMEEASKGIKVSDQNSIVSCINDLRWAALNFAPVMEWRRINGDADMVDARTGKRYQEVR